MLVPGVPAAARVLQLAQQAAERVNLMLIGELLPLGVFDQFQNFFHALQGLFQGFDDSHHLVDGLADGRTLRVARHWTGRFLPGRNGFTGRGTGGRFGPIGLAGFFCNGEIGPVGEKNFLHGYTASLALFVKKQS